MTTTLIHGSVVSFQPERRTVTSPLGTYGILDEAGAAPVFLWPGLNTGFSVDIEETFEEIQHNPSHENRLHTLEEIRNVKVGEELAFNINVHPQVGMHWPLLKFITGDAYGLGDQPDSTTWMKELNAKWSVYTGVMMEDLKIEIPGIGVAKETYSGFAGHRLLDGGTNPGYGEASEEESRPIVWSDIQAIQMGPIGLGAWGLKTTPATEKGYQDLCYGNGIYVAVANAGVTKRIMTSPDAVTWTLVDTPAGNDIDWNGVCYGSAGFVAVGSEIIETVVTPRIMTSPDAVTWTLQTAPAGNQVWQSVTYGNSLYVSVASASVSNTDRVMTSPDAVTWTLQASVNKDNAWQSITHANDLFVVVSSTGTLDMVMTSPDAVTWTSRTTPAGNNAWKDMCYGNGLYVAVADTGTLNRVMTSPDGKVWTLQVSPAGDNNWQGITYGNGLYVAVSDTGALNRVMTSPDAVTWTLRTTPAGNNDWQSVICVNGNYVAVGDTGTADRVMTSVSTVIDIAHCVSDISFGFTNEVVKVLDAPIGLSTGIEDVCVVSRKMFVTLKLSWINQTFINTVLGTGRLYLRMAIGASPDMTTFEFWGLRWPKYIAKADPKEVIGDTITSIVDRPGFRYSTT